MSGSLPVSQVNRGQVGANWTFTGVQVDDDDDVGDNDDANDGDDDDDNDDAGAIGDKTASAKRRRQMQVT